MKKKFELLVCVVNSGFSQTCMDAARNAGARGGTVLHARGTSSKLIEQQFGITISPEKEMVMILVTLKIKDEVMLAINNACGLQTPSRGIVFSLPVNDVAGLKLDEFSKIEENKED